MNVPDHVNLQDINDQRRRSEEKKQQEENTEKDRQRLMYRRITYKFLASLLDGTAINIQPDPLYLLPWDDAEVDQIIEEIDYEHRKEAGSAFRQGKPVSIPKESPSLMGEVTTAEWKYYANRPSTGPHFTRLPHPARITMLQMIHDAFTNKCKHFGQPELMPSELMEGSNWSTISHMRTGQELE